MFTLGIGRVISWNSLLNTFDYFDQETFGFRPSFSYPFAIMGLMMLSQIVNMFYGHKFSDKTRVTTSFFVTSICLLILPVLPQLIDSHTVKYWSGFGILLVFGIFQGILNGQLFATASFLPSKYVGALI